MVLTRAKYRRVPDLYVQGREVVLRDGTVMWLQAVNPLQRDECQHDAQVARSRLVMALKSGHGSDERTKVEAAFWQDSRAGAIDRLVETKTAEALVKTLTEIKDDPEWAERLEIMDRSEELLARPAEDSERALLVQINDEYIAEVGKRQEDEAEYLRRHYEAFTDEDLIESYVELYIDRRGADLAAAEFTITELWYAVRACEGTQVDDQWDHSACEHHELQVYVDKSEVRALPEDLQNLLGSELDQLNLSVREAKNSDRQQSSSVSSPLPSKPEASTPSTPTGTPDEPVGSSLSPSDKPSPS